MARHPSCIKDAIKCFGKSQGRTGVIHWHWWLSYNRLFSLSLVKLILLPRSCANLQSLNPWRFIQGPTSLDLDLAFGAVDVNVDLACTLLLSLHSAHSPLPSPLLLRLLLLGSPSEIQEFSLIESQKYFTFEGLLDRLFPLLVVVS